MYKRDRFDFNRAAMGLDIPARIALPLIEYIFKGTDPGDFLRSVLENNLRNAIIIGKVAEVVMLKPLVTFINENAPAISWSGIYYVQDWKKQGGLEGVAA